MLRWLWGLYLGLSERQRALVVVFLPVVLGTTWLYLLGLLAVVSAPGWETRASADQPSPTAGSPPVLTPFPTATLVARVPQGPPPPPSPTARVIRGTATPTLMPTPTEYVPAARPPVVIATVGPPPLAAGTSSPTAARPLSPTVVPRGTPVLPRTPTPSPGPLRPSPTPTPGPAGTPTRTPTRAAVATATPRRGPAAIATPTRAAAQPSPPATARP